MLAKLHILRTVSRGSRYLSAIGSCRQKYNTDKTLMTHSTAHTNSGAKVNVDWVLACCNIKRSSRTCGILECGVIVDNGGHQTCRSNSFDFFSGIRHISTVNQSEVNKFSRLAPYWWDEEGSFAALHSLNLLRVPFIRDGLLGHSDLISSTPLEGYKILDVGCGGGVLAEPLARLGADVTGVDASQENIEVATRHAALDEGLGSRLRYVCSSVEELNSSEQMLYDTVVMSEVIEHIDDVDGFLETCCSMLKPGGSLFITTINRTISSYMFAIVAAESLLRIVPPGSHEWHKFIQPEELQEKLSKNSLTTRLVHGMMLNPATLNWSWCSLSDCNYALHAVKNHEIVAKSTQK